MSGNGRRRGRRGLHTSDRVHAFRLIAVHNSDGLLSKAIEFLVGERLVPIIGFGDNSTATGERIGTRGKWINILLLIF